jgi:hypothetical protein
MRRTTSTPLALLPGGVCPVCRGSFHGYDACSHGWSAVKKHNDKFVLDYLLRMEPTRG